MLEMMTGSILKKISKPGLEIDPEVFEKLMASDGAANDKFGTSVATSSDGFTIIVGTPYDDDKGTDSGSVYIFTKQANGSYLQTQKLIASDGAGGHRFGWPVVTFEDGSTIIVSCYQDNDKGTNSGSVYIFTKQANGSYLQSQKLVASDGAANDNFGHSVAVSSDGSTIVVGATYDDDKGIDSGSVYIFTKQANGTYLQIQKLVPSDGVKYGGFGYSVATYSDGSTIIVSSYGLGSAYVFTKQANGTYLQIQKLVPSDGVVGFGYKVVTSSDGSTIIVGVPLDDDKGTDSGSVYIFTKQANGSYLQTQKLVATDGAASDNFGHSVAVSSDGSTIVVGATYDDDKGTDSGSAYIFTKQANGSYLQTQKLVPSDGAGNDKFGYSVAISQTSVVVGTQNHLGNGAVYVF